MGDLVHIMHVNYIALIHYRPDNYIGHIHIQYRLKVWGQYDFFMLLKEVSYLHEGCIYLPHDSLEIIVIY